jgi:hypothetical protein
VDALVQCIQDIPSGPESCNGFDDDCDGDIDNGDPGGGGACDTGEPGQCAAGTEHCQDGNIVCEQDLVAEPEVCGDDTDNDCNGTVDNGCCTDLILDGGLEQGTPNPDWYESSTNFPSVICDNASCGNNPDYQPYAGTYWAWFGGIEGEWEEGILSQDVLLPAGNDTTLEFMLALPACDASWDTLEIQVDDEILLIIDGSDPDCGDNTYRLESIDIGAYADGGVHKVEFYSITNSTQNEVTNFFVDNIVVNSCIP